MKRCCDLSAKYIVTISLDFTSKVCTFVDFSF
jgi:hypothetical protein